MKFKGGFLNKSKPIPIDYIKECLTYNEVTGEFFWKERPISHFKSKCAYIRFNKNYPNKKAGRLEKTKSGYPYWAVTIDKVVYKQHRIAWAWFNGDFRGYIDHINRDSTDNSLKNLRVVSVSENSYNTSKLPKNAWWGVRHKGNRWEVYFTENGETRYMSSFDTEKDAVCFRKSLEKDHNVFRGETQ